MSTLEFLTWLQNTPVAHAVSKSDHLVGAALQVVHVLGFVLLLAALLLASLRVLGLAFGRQPAADITGDALPLIWWGLAAAAVSGALMFVSAPTLYFYKPVFIAKLLLLAAAVAVQALLFGRVSGGARRVSASAAPSAATSASADVAPSPALARAVAVLSLALWFAVAAAGRAIGFA
ncbi:hypothetical protein [Derxia lacustris]|uniref:hypothetical protein n=1 Tax=Derxia lacustris TaxID=764842 RepID=UPI000A174FB7|nr:hypothetical protein [Derxia lacustris]